MPPTSLIYAVHETDTDGKLLLHLYRRPATKVLDYTEVESWGILGTSNRPVFIWFRGDLYLVGAYSRPLVRHRAEGRWRPAGIRAPEDTLVVAEGSGSGGSSGQAVAYITFLHKAGDLLLAESNPSNVVSLADQTGKGYNWTLPTAGAEARVTHVRGYRSMNGGAYRKAFEVPYGTSAYTENVRTNQLLQNGPDDHGLPPNGVKLAEKAFGRMWYARTNEHPYRLWGSEPGQPQYVGVTSYRDTEDREAITALRRHRDVLLVFCKNSLYLLRRAGSGFGFSLQKVDEAVGCISHWAIRTIHNKVWFPATDGVWLYDGGLRYMMADIRNFWKEDYEANVDLFANSFAIDDRSGKDYILYVPRPGKAAFQDESSVGTVAYVGNYLNSEPSLGGANAEPDWSIDVVEREALGAFYSDAGEALVADDDGTVRVYSDTDADDDSDTLLKHLTIRSPHNLFMDPGDDPEGGKKFVELWVHVQSELNAWTLSLFGGDEAAGGGLPRDNVSHWWKKLVSASRELTISGAYLVRYVAKSVHNFVPEKVGGRGLTVQIDADSPQGMSYRGFGGFYLPGAEQRGQELQAGVASSAVYACDLARKSGQSYFGMSSPLAAGTYTFRLRVTASSGFTMPATMGLTLDSPSGRTEFTQVIATFSSPEDFEQEFELEVGTNVLSGWIIDAADEAELAQFTIVGT